jgi:hypothetical protein
MGVGVQSGHFLIRARPGRVPNAQAVGRPNVGDCSRNARDHARHGFARRVPGGANVSHAVAGNDQDVPSVKLSEVDEAITAAFAATIVAGARLAMISQHGQGGLVSVIRSAVQIRVEGSAIVDADESCGGAMRIETRR